MVKDASIPSPGVNWQTVADSIVARFGPRLSYLKAGHFSHDDSLRNQTILVIEPYIDWDHRNFTMEVERCAHQYIPALPRLSLAGQAILQVTTKICNTLLAATSVENSVAMKMLDDLMDYLAWTTWKRCTPGCRDDEICFTAIWPFGKPEDIETPLCVNATGFPERMGYWDDPFLRGWHSEQAFL
jgi:hypothetical protein